MRDIIIIPTFDRPEYLLNCIENLRGVISKSFGTEKWIWITEDIHSDKPKSFTTQWEMMSVIREANKLFGLTFRYMATQPHSTFGNSYNVLNAIQEAAVYDDVDKVYLIEDDVMITDDFFRWNEEVHAKFQPWASCAGRLNRSLNFAMNGPEALDETFKDTRACRESVTAYNSWATCFSRQALQDISQMAYGHEHFRPGYEQDIMIQNHIRRNKLPTIWPYVPRAYHMGWYSYHRDGMRFNGTLEEKIKSLRSTVKNQSRIKSMACIQDIDAFPTTQHEPVTGLYLR